jgi:uncharacterized membrane protein
MKAQHYQWLTLASYFALMFSLVIWIVVMPHSENFPTAAWLIIGVVPLLFPMRGLLHGKPYTHAWASFLMLFYFTHGIGELYSSQFSELFAWLEVIFSMTSFMAMILFVKKNAKEQKRE